MKFGDVISSRHIAWKNNPVVRTMKLTIIILTTFLMQVSAAGLAQNVYFVKKNASLKELFTEIRRQTGYNVFWQEGKVDEDIKFNASFNAIPLADVLQRVLKPAALEFRIVNQTIVVKQKDETFLDRISAYIAAIDVEGKIIDAETGKAIPKATVSLKGSTRSVVANENGSFRFSGLPNNAILVFSSIGYVSQSIPARSSMEVKMVPASQTLEDVVVSTGYQTLKQNTATGAYTVVTAKDIESTPSINLLERLEGKVPGVLFDIRNNKIEIRGVSSYPNQVARYQPLVVIDGFPSSNQDLATMASGLVTGSLTYRNQPANSGNALIGTFNPADIESITFLKDAAATAIWGARAANGVIVITTKRGRPGHSEINFGATLSTAAAGNFSNLTSMNSAQYIELEQEMVNKNLISDPVAALISSPANGWRSQPVSEATEWMFKAKRNPAYQAQADSALRVLSNRSNIDQLRDNLLQRAVTQQYNLSFSGGGGNSSYYVSGNYTKDQPVYRSNSGSQYSVMSNLTNNFLNNRLTLSTGINYNYAKTQVNSAALQALGTGSFGLAPYSMLLDENGNKIYRGIAFTTRVSDSLTRVRGLMPWTYNAIDELNYGNTIGTNNSLRFTASINGKVTSWLNASVSGQLEKGWQDSKQLQNQDSYYARNFINEGTNSANLATGGSIYGFPKGGIYTTANFERDNYSLRGQLDAKKDFGKDHSIQFVAGTEIRQERTRSVTQDMYGYNEDLGTFANINTSRNGSLAGYYTTIYGQRKNLPTPNTFLPKNTRRYLSYYSTGSYAYQQKYFATASVRFDDINVLGASRKARATPLWSGGLRWDVKKEELLQSVKWISQFSIRGSYGTAGNPPSSAANVSTVQLTIPDSYTQLPVTTIGVAANPDLNWEVTRMFNIGLDAGFLANRLMLTMDLYTKRTKDILIGLPINSAYGLNSLQYNAGSLSGHGVELSLTGDLVRGRDWNWTANINGAYNTNTVTESRFPNIQTNVGAASGLTVGLPTDNFFVYRWAGLDNKGQSQIYAADGSIIPSTNNVIVAQDLVSAGRTTAPYNGGFSNTVKYKNLSLSARATFYLGHKFIYQGITADQYPTNGSVSGLMGTSRDLVNRWRVPGDEAFTDVPGLVGVNINSVNRYISSDLNVRDAGQIRLQQISLSYSVPNSLLRHASFIKKVNIGATVSNVGLIWVANKEGIDPSYQMTTTYLNLPPTRNYVVNLSLSL
jgi:TonB-linked SusC/RagA family outer membrane protein